MSATFKFQLLKRFVKTLGHQRSRRLAGFAGERLGSRFIGDKTQNHSSNLALVDPSLSSSELAALSSKAIGNYARYFVDLIGLGSISPDQVDDGFTVSGYEHIQHALDTGTGPILVLPHVGSWEWGAAWLVRVAGEKVVVAVERLEPPEVFNWFEATRNSYGLEVVGLGNDSFKQLSAAVRENKIVCLLSDRDLGAKAVPVELFGQSLNLPVGPALLAKRTGAQLIPTAVYMTETGAHCEVLPPISESLVKGGSAADVTQAVADSLAELIKPKLDQWYVLEQLVEPPDAANA